MKRTFALLLALLLSILICTAGLAEGQAEMHLFLDIPFDVSISEFARRVEAATGVQGVMDNSYTVQEIQYLGYPLRLYADPELERIDLSNGHAVVKPEAFQAQLEQDVLQFIGMERALIELYGEPDHRFFFIDGRWETQRMFPENVWDADKMLAICEKEGRLYPYSVWNNVVLMMRVYSKAITYGGYKTGVVLYYYSTPADPNDFHIVPYDPESGE